MKLKFLKLVLLLALIFGCNKEETTGDLIVFVEDINGTAITNETVYLYNNQADYNNAIYSKTEVTNNQGRVKFSFLDPGVYYVDCDFNNAAGGVTTVSGDGSVSAGFETTITIGP